MHKRQHPTGYGLFLLLSACGVSNAPDRGDSPISVSGRVFADRQIAGARVYVDVNNNKRFDEQDHYIGETDQTGAYQGTIPSEHRGKPLLADLTDARDLSAPAIKLSGIWRAPEGSTVISPLTDLMVMLDKDSEEIFDLIGLATDIDLTIYDPFSDGEPDPTDRRVIEIDPNLVQKLIKEKHQLEEKITELSDVVSVFDKVKTIEVAENHDRNDALYTFTPPPGLIGGKFALTKGYMDNHLFTIDEKTGMLYVKNFRGPEGTHTFDYESPYDRGYDNTYDVHIVFQHYNQYPTQLQIIVTDENEHYKEQRPKGEGDPIHELNTIRFAPNRLSSSNQPPGDMKYIIEGLAPIMPLTGPLTISYGLDLKFARNGVHGEDEIKQAKAHIDRAIAEFESVGVNINFVKSTSDDPADFDMPFRFTDSVYSGILGNGSTAVYVGVYLSDNRFHSVLVHEMGHYMGLKHNFDKRNGWPEVDDSVEWGKKTVMSYARERSLKQDERALTDLDVSALRWLYGEKGKDGGGAEQRIGYDQQTLNVSQTPIDIHENYSTEQSIFNAVRESTSHLYEYAKIRLIEDQKDNNLFRIDSDGNVYFKKSPDYETPMDHYGGAKFSGNNTYIIGVEWYEYYGEGKARNGWNSTGDYAVNVTDVLEIA